MGHRLSDLGHAVEEAISITRLCLDAHFYSFERTERNISDEFSGSRSGQVDQILVLLRILLTSQIGVVLFEKLVESKLACTLLTRSRSTKLARYSA